MLKFLKKHYSKFIFLLFVIVGIVRMQQIVIAQAGRTTMKGVFTLYAYSFAGLILAVAAVICRLIYRSRMNKIAAITLCIFILAVVLLAGGYSIAYFEFF